MNRDPLDLIQAKILIVDDVPANIDTLRAPLETAGYQVLIATSGEGRAGGGGRPGGRPDPALRDDARARRLGIDHYKLYRKMREA